MNDSSGESGQLEAAVVENLQRLHDTYRQLEELADGMLAMQGRGESIEQSLERMKLGRAKIVEIETRGAAAAERYRATVGQSSAAVNALTQQTKQLIERLMMKVGKLEQSARDSYQHLAPEIDRSVRAHQMKQAYRTTIS